MNIGDVVVFIGCNDSQIKWGNCDDPNKVLYVGKQYTIKSVDGHSWHTKLELEGVHGKFNSVCFEVKP